MTDHIPALEDVATNERVVMHLNTLHAARKVYIKAETSDQIRRALRHNVRITMKHTSQVIMCFSNVRIVTDDMSQQVSGQDGKVVFVRNGDQLVRVSTCRIVKFGSEFQTRDKNCMKKGLSCDYDRINDDKRYHSESDDEHDSTTQSNKANDHGLPNAEGSKDAEDDNNFDQTRSEGDLHDYNQTTNRLSNRAVNELGKVVPKKDDKIRHRLDQDSKSIKATVIGRGGKSIGQNKFYFNICRKDYQKQGVYLDRVEFEVIEDFESDNETIYIAQVLVDQHNKPSVNLAKERELQNWKNFSVYSEVEDQGQQTLSTR